MNKSIINNKSTPVVHLGQNHLAPKRPLRAKFFRESFFALKFTKAPNSVLLLRFLA